MAGNRLKLLTIPLAREEDAVRQSNAAYGVFIDGSGFVWFPKSQIEDFWHDELSVSFWCPEWLIEAKEVEAFIDTSREPSLFG